LTYRNQWPGIPATFVTYGAALVVPVRTLSSGFGISIMNDMQGSGVINKTSASLLYGYAVDIGNNWRVGAGLSASWVMKRFNADELVFRTDLLNELGYSYGPAIMDNYTRDYPDFSIGLIASNPDNFTVGISASHVTRPRDTFSEAVSSRLPLKYTAFFSKRISRFAGYDDISLEPAVFYSIQSANQELIWGSRVDFASSFMLGAYIRQNLKMNLESIIISAGFSWEKYNISYHYDVNMKKINFLSTKMAAHEVTFLYRFKYNEQHKTRISKKNLCPAY
jgi:type IX secretion system PorP/SprF family membrane protein